MPRFQKIRQIKAVTSHKSDASIESYCETPTLRQFQSKLRRLPQLVGQPNQSQALQLK